MSSEIYKEKKPPSNKGWCPNDEKPKDHVTMISYKWKKGMSIDRTQKAVPMMKNEWNRQIHFD